MSFNLRLYFAGLMVFTPRNGGMDALLVDARNANRLPGTRGLENHFPALQYEDRNWHSGPGKSFKDSERQKKRLWRLDDRILSLDPTTTTVETTLRRTVSNSPLGKVPTNKIDAERLDWVNTIFDGNGNPGKLKPGLLSPGAQGPVVTAVRLDRGRLRPAGFASEGLDFAVGEVRPDVIRTIATTVVLEATVTSPRARLVATLFNGTQPQILELKPDPHATSDVVEVWAMNLEWAVMRYQRIPPRNLPNNLPSPPDPEYYYFYDLLQNPPANPHLPRVVGRIASTATPPVEPAQALCNDSVMDDLFFPSRHGGQLSAAAPCSPIQSG